MKTLKIVVEKGLFVVVEDTAEDRNNENYGYGVTLYNILMKKEATVVIDIASEENLTAYSLVCENHSVAAEMVKRIRADVRNPIAYLDNNSGFVDVEYFQLINPKAPEVKFTVSGNFGGEYRCKLFKLESIAGKFDRLEKELDSLIEDCQKFHKEFGVEEKKEEEKKEKKEKKKEKIKEQNLFEEEFQLQLFNDIQKVFKETVKDSFSRTFKYYGIEKLIS